MAYKYKRQTKCKTCNNGKNPVSLAKKVSRIEMHALRALEKKILSFTRLMPIKMPLYLSKRRLDAYNLSAIRPPHQS